MGLASKSWTGLWAGMGLVAFSQAPEFSTQYMQRLGGGIEELKIVVDQFDTDAQAQGLDRQSALAALKESAESFPRQRGISMEKVIARHQNLIDQRAAMQAGSILVRPVKMMANPDNTILQGTVADYQPAIPLNEAGALWGGAGALLLGLIGRFPVSISQWRRRRKAPRIHVQAVQDGPEFQHSMPPEQSGLHDQERAGDGAKPKQVTGR